MNNKNSIKLDVHDIRPYLRLKYTENICRYLVFEMSHRDNHVITDHVRSTSEGYVFTCICLFTDGRVHPVLVLSGGSRVCFCLGPGTMTRDLAKG